MADRAEVYIGSAETVRTESPVGLNAGITQRYPTSLGIDLANLTGAWYTFQCAMRVHPGELAQHGYQSDDGEPPLPGPRWLRFAPRLWRRIKNRFAPPYYLPARWLITFVYADGTTAGLLQKQDNASERWCTFSSRIMFGMPRPIKIQPQIVPEGELPLLIDFAHFSIEQDSLTTPYVETGPHLTGSYLMAVEKQG